MTPLTESQVDGLPDEQRTLAQALATNHASLRNEGSFAASLACTAIWVLEQSGWRKPVKRDATG